MHIYINNKAHLLKQPKSLAAILQEHELYTTPGIAVAVNQRVIPKIEWDQIEVQENDQLLIITATQGG